MQRQDAERRRNEDYRRYRQENPYDCSVNQCQ
jgi:hypothetical protein